MPHKTTKSRVWTKMPPKKTKPTIAPALKAEVTDQVQDLVEHVLKPRYIHAPPAAPDLNYISDIFIRWYRSYLYCCATYSCPGPDAIAPSFEARFARLEFAGQRHFHLAFMGHTGEWITLYEDLTPEECLSTIRDDPYFQMG